MAMRKKRDRSPTGGNRQVKKDVSSSSQQPSTTTGNPVTEKTSTIISGTSTLLDSGAIAKGVRILEELLQMPLTTFLEKYHDKKHLVLKRQDPTFYSQQSDPTKKPGVEIQWSTKDMRDAIVRGLKVVESPLLEGDSVEEEARLLPPPEEEVISLHYGTDLNIVKMNKETRKRVPFKTEGAVTLADMEHAMQSGWSVRFLRPHEHSSALSRLIYFFEAALGCSCGANTYWTPAGSQGFAPHYDDVDVFLLQLEGSKRWRLYKPFNEDEDKLARYSSPDYDPAQMPPPLADFNLGPGDLLYMPRGTIHQGVTSPDSHSLHITMSGFQMHSFADLIKVLLARHVECVARDNLSLRRSLPQRWYDSVGALNNNKLRYEELELPPVGGVRAKERKELLNSIRQCLSDVTSCGSTGMEGVKSAETIDLACDAFATDVIARKQPPPLSPSSSVVVVEAKHRCIRLLDPTSVRMVLKDTEVELVNCQTNSEVCMARPVAKLRFERSFAPAIATLLVSGCSSKGILVSSLPFPDFEEDDDEEGGVADENRDLLINSLIQNAPGLFKVV